MPSTRAAALAAVLSSASSVATAFTSPSVTSSAAKKTTATSIYSTVDPSVVTKKEYQDICGVDFDDRTLSDRLKKTAYLYPKHVEVIEDFEPLVNKMVDEIVSGKFMTLCKKTWGGTKTMLTPSLLFSLLHVINRTPLTNNHPFFCCMYLFCSHTLTKTLTLE